MKKTFKRLVSVALSAALVLSVPAAASAYSTGSYSVGVSNGSRAGSNVRTGPGTGYDKVGAACYDSEFQVDQISGDWGHTNSIYCTNGWQSGWINLGFCTEKGGSWSYTGDATVSSSAQAVVDMAESYLGYNYSTFTSWFYGRSQAAVYKALGVE